MEIQTFGFILGGTVGFALAWMVRGQMFRERLRNMAHEFSPEIANVLRALGREPRSKIPGNR